MSIPRDILDQLLSGYMDDVLSNDERARVDQLLRDNGEVARELEELRDLRETLREIHREDQQLHLGANFADRVLKATVDQAAAEGLSEDHPVMLLTQQPSTVVTRPALPIAKIAGVVATLAASIIVAFAVFRTPNQDPEQAALAQSDPAQVEPVDVPPQNVIEQEAPGVPAPIEQLALDDTPNSVSTPDVVEMPVKDSHAISMPNAISTPVDNVANVSSPPTTPGPGSSPAPSISLKDLDPRLLTHGLVFVVDVQQTEKGRDGNAVGRAISKAGIQAADQKQIDENVVGFKKKLVGEDQSVSVLYLRDSGKKIDNLINAMVADLDGIQSVGFALATDAPIIGVVDALKRIDPRTVRHDTNWQLTDDGSNSLQLLVQELGSRKFSQLQRGGTAAAFAGNKQGEGPDIKSSIFILVR